MARKAEKQKKKKKKIGFLFRFVENPKKQIRLHVFSSDDPSPCNLNYLWTIYAIYLPYPI